MALTRLARDSWAIGFGLVGIWVGWDLGWGRGLLANRALAKPAVGIMPFAPTVFSGFA